MKYFLALFMTLLLTGCSESVEVEDTPSSYDSNAPEAEEASEYSGEEFHGYPCTDDCSGHEAGYQWAEENGITNPDDCGGNSNSFMEGCQAYAEEQ